MLQPPVIARCKIMAEMNIAEATNLASAELLLTALGASDR
jgi:hypothetical protein